MSQRYQCPLPPFQIQASIKIICTTDSLLTSEYNQFGLLKVQMSKSRHGAGTSCAPGSVSDIWQNNICKWVLCTLGTKLQNLIYITKCNANSNHKGAVFTLGFGPAILKYTKYNQCQSTPPNPTQPNPPQHSWCTSTPAILEPNSDNVMRSDWSITERLHSHSGLHIPAQKCWSETFTLRFLTYLALLFFAKKTKAWQVEHIALIACQGTFKQVMM